MTIDVVLPLIVLYCFSLDRLGGGDFVFAYLADEDAPHASTSLHKSITENLSSLGESGNSTKLLLFLITWICNALNVTPKCKSERRYCGSCWLSGKF